MSGTLQKAWTRLYEDNCRRWTRRKRGKGSAAVEIEKERKDRDTSLCTIVCRIRCHSGHNTVSIQHDVSVCEAGRCLIVGVCRGGVDEL